jgi:CheY-like chemotaxis protein
MEQDRVLSPDEIEFLLNFTISAESLWDVLISTRDEKFFTEVRNLFLEDDRVVIRMVENGCDALISCVRNTPDLLILDAGLSDISLPDIVGSLRRDQKLKSIPILCRVKDYPPTGVLDWGADDYIRSEEDVDKIYLARKMHSLLYSSTLYDESCQTEPHERRWPRTKLNITTQITVSQPANPERTERGEAVIENISLGGAYLSGIRMESGVLPRGAFTVTLHINQPILRNWYADSIIVHQVPEGNVGVKFVNISKDDRLKVAELFLE